MLYSFSIFILVNETEKGKYTMKTEYTKIIENSTKKARLLTKRISDLEYEIVEMDIPIELRFSGIEDELLKEVTDDADNEGITLRVDINRMMTND